MARRIAASGIATPAAATEMRQDLKRNVVLRAKRGALFHWRRGWDGSRLTPLVPRSRSGSPSRRRRVGARHRFAGRRTRCARIANPAPPMKQGPPLGARGPVSLAERVGFEPTSNLAATTGIPVRRLRPLGHLSGRGARLQKPPRCGNRGRRGRARPRRCYCFGSAGLGSAFGSAGFGSAAGCALA